MKKTLLTLAVILAFGELGAAATSTFTPTTTFTPTVTNTPRTTTSGAGPVVVNFQKTPVVKVLMQGPVTVNGITVSQLSVGTVVIEPGVGTINANVVTEPNIVTTPLANMSARATTIDTNVIAALTPLNNASARATTLDTNITAALTPINNSSARATTMDTNLIAALTPLTNASNRATTLDTNVAAIGTPSMNTSNHATTIDANIIVALTPLTNASNRATTLDTNLIAALTPLTNASNRATTIDASLNNIEDGTATINARVSAILTPVVIEAGVTTLNVSVSNQFTPVPQFTQIANPSSFPPGAPVTTILNNLTAGVTSTASQNSVSVTTPVTICAALASNYNDIWLEVYNHSSSGASFSLAEGATVRKTPYLPPGGSYSTNYILKGLQTNVPWIFTPGSAVTSLSVNCLSHQRAY